MPGEVTYSALFNIQTAGYRPPLQHRPPFLYMGLPPFTIETVEWMRRDPQVKLGMALKIAPLMKPKWKITGNPEQVKFVETELRNFWLGAIPDVLKALWYTVSACEMVYRMKDGRVHFHAAKPLYPSDVRILTRAGVKHGIKVKVRGTEQGTQAAGNAATATNDVTLLGPKSFLYVHRREFGSWHGISELEGAYDPWTEKADIAGAKAIRKMWYYKNSFDSGILFHPPGSYVDPDDHTRRIPYRDLARQALEVARTGGVWAFDNVLDERGNRLWDYQRPQMNGSGAELLEYVDHLDTEILRGLEIPDDVVSQVSGTGSFAGRTIPLISFFLGQAQHVRTLTTEAKQQWLDWLVLLNYGSIDYEIEEATVNIEGLMPAGPGEAPKDADGKEDPPRSSATKTPAVPAPRSTSDSLPEPSRQVE